MSKKNPRWDNFINAPWAARLIDRGMKPREVGVVLARHEGRAVPYRAESVRHAIRNWRDGKGNTQEYFG